MCFQVIGLYGLFLYEVVVVVLLIGYMGLFKKQTQVETDNQVDDNQVENSQVESNQVENNQVESNQVENNQVENNQVENSQVENNQVENNQVEYGQLDWKVKKLISIFIGELSRAEVKSLLDLTDGEYARQKYIAPSLKLGYLEMTLPDTRSSKLQKYRLTAKGEGLKSYLKVTISNLKASKSK
jgi:preprotein translocase subunit SecF